MSCSSSSTVSFLPARVRTWPLRYCRKPMESFCSLTITFAFDLDLALMGLLLSGRLDAAAPHVPDRRDRSRVWPPSHPRAASPRTLDADVREPSAGGVNARSRCTDEVAYDRLRSVRDPVR